MMKQLLVWTLVALPVSAQAKDLDTLTEWMTGSFSSEAQAAADSAYYDVRLELVRIWQEREDGVWLYVEQAIASSQERPYRQRVYHVTDGGDGMFRSEAYSLPNPLRFVGDWKEEAPLATLTPDSLEIREGCAVYLKAKDGAFVGGTLEETCGSSLRGASYAISEVTVTAEGVTSWDRGFNGDGTQTWGAEEGPYVFLKKE